MALFAVQRTVLSSADGKTSVEFDCTSEAETINEARVTRYPIENGADIADHMVVTPSVIRLDILQSSASLDAQAMNPEVLYETLLGLQADRTLCVLEMYNRTDDNFLITMLRRTQTSEFRDSVMCQVELTRVLLVTTGVPRIPVPKEVVAIIVKRQTDVGEKTLKDCKEPTKSAAEAKLAQLPDENSTTQSFARGLFD